MAGLTAARRIFEILETPLPASGAALSEQEVLPAALPGVIRFQDVHYSYDQGPRSALKGVSFTLQPGQRVALVGPSGAGKSTVAHLLLRFIEPGEGIITVNGTPLPTLDTATWRQHLAWVPQNPYLFHGSVIENIRLARPEAGLEEVIEAARQAHADSFIQALPQGYDTLIGERGVRLSGGQAQRLALARAFLKDAPLLILDEATANLDPTHEAHIQAAIERLVAGRTALIIAHRLSTVFSADKILVMTGGKIVETGAHAALIRQQGLYSRLVTAYGGAT
jgi:ATP-binding cassette subfamily C protein CydD